MRILLTGSTGVIGRRVVPLLLKAGHQLTAVARSPEKRLALERAGAAAVTVDLFDPLAVRQAVRGHDAVVNLATHIPSAARAFLPGAWRENSRVRQGRAQLLGRPEAYWSMVSHDDAASAVVAALDVAPGIYNVVDDEPLTRRELVDSIAAALGVSPPKLLPGWLKYLLGSLGET